MATLTVIVGYCGSGKTWWLDSKKVEHPDAFFMNEGAQLYPDGNLHEDVAAALATGQNCFVGLMDCARVVNRAALEKSVGEKAPGATIEWVFYENAVAKANENCRRDPTRKDADGNVRQNNACAADYSVPEGMEALPIYELPEPNREREPA